MILGDRLGAAGPPRDGAPLMRGVSTAASQSYHDADPAALAERLTRLARNIVPRQVAASPRGPKPATKKGFVDGAVARAQVATARVLAQTKAKAP